MKIFSKLKSLNKKSKILMAGLLVAAVAAVPLSANAGFFPNRSAYDYNKPCNPNDSDPYDSCGSLTGPVFNSFKNVPGVGDERAFLDGFRSDQTQAGSHADPVRDVSKGSKEVVFRMYVHNNSNESKNCSANHLNSKGKCTQIDWDASGIAKDTKVKIELPTNTDDALRAVGSVTASNASPNEVVDSLDVTSTEKFKVEYVAGSAKLYNYGPFKNGVALSDSIVSSGAPIGYNSLNGKLPGCFDYTSIVEIKIRVIPEAPKNQNLKLTKQVRKVGDTEWKSEVTSAPGQQVQWMLNTKNTGEIFLNDVITRDILPPHVALVPGSVKFYNAKGSVDLADQPLFTSGYNAGRYNPNDNTLIAFKTNLLDDFEGCEVRVRNVAKATAATIPEARVDDADVVIKKENCVPPPVSFKCDALAVQKLSDTSFKFTASGSATNATITGYKFNLNGSEVQDSASNMYTLNQNTPGDYTVSAIVKTDKGNTSPSEKCTKKITINQNPPVFSCDALNFEKLSDVSFKFTAVGSATNATITGYKFSTNGVLVQDSASNMYTLNADKPGDYTVSAIVKTDKGNTSPSEKCTKKVTVKDNSPIISCDGLAVQKLSDTSFKFTASGSATNATITGYKFKLNGSEVQDSASNMYTLNQQTPGEYTVAAIVKTDKGNTQPTAVCTKTVKVEEKPPTPEYSCDLLTLSSLEGRKVRFSVDATATNGAVIKNYIYNFGDGSQPLTSDKNIVDYEYAKDGTFNSSVQVVVDVNGETKTVTSNNCAASITFSPPTCEDNPNTPNDECNPCVNNPNTPDDECSPCEDNPNTPNDDCSSCDDNSETKAPECNPSSPPSTPTNLPNTGAGDIIGIFFSVTVGGMVAYNLVVRRFAGQL